MKRKNTRPKHQKTEIVTIKKRQRTRDHGKSPTSRTLEHPRNRSLHFSRSVMRGGRQWQMQTPEWEMQKYLVFYPDCGKSRLPKSKTYTEKGRQRRERSSKRPLLNTTSSHPLTIHRAVKTARVKATTKNQARQVKATKMTWSHRSHRKDCHLSLSVNTGQQCNKRYHWNIQYLRLRTNFPWWRVRRQPSLYS